jgi:8-oxo-dGTP pyrophosphatase MutT (NUDIX family)
MRYFYPVDKYLETLAQALKEPLPGWEAHRKMINYVRPKATEAEQIDPEANKGAVLALIYPKERVPHIVLMLRNPYSGAHGNQVSFPGGKYEEKDQVLLQTALREAEEEVGVDPAEVSILGELSKIYIPPSRFLVSPFLGTTLRRPRFRPDPIEVAEIIESPLENILSEKRIKRKPIFVSVLNREVEVKYFDLNGHVVWGATAMILSEIRELLLKSPNSYL